MGRTRRKASSEKECEENLSSCSTPPAKDKENCFPASIRERSSFAITQQQQIIALRKDYDNNVAMTIMDMLTNKQVMIENLTRPFCTALVKMPPNIKKMKWADYLKMKEDATQETLNVLPLNDNPSQESVPDLHTFAVPTGLSKMETPALRSSSRLAKNKIPIITPKFDPSTGAIITKRLPKPGEVLFSLKGSPVATNTHSTKLSARELSNLAATEDKDLVVAFLKNPENFNTFKAFEKTYNSRKMRKE
ncbi:hypothetical protein GHT06_008231 [Daphnia sinensis]|uniref:Uncharacterized protein n=1 Tax=Daphnia sinensis TaxID=1820382 RepID=A0AAD5L1R6_9CRUS|nr:hypothetical protein GHT06_008231 [Daphnia sinensis]